MHGRSTPEMQITRPKLQALSKAAACLVFWNKMRNVSQKLGSTKHSAQATLI
jgi:hypothetical protein